MNRYPNRTSIAMVSASLGIVGYSLIDKIAAEVIWPGPGSAAVCGYILFFVTWVTLAGAVKLTRHPHCPSGSLTWPTSALAAVACFGAYWLVLWAYQMTE